MPNTKVMRRWDAFVVSLLLFTAAVTPFEVALLDPPVLSVLWTINRVVDFGFIVDMVVNFFLAYRQEQTNVIVTDNKKIARSVRGPRVSWP